MTMVVMREEAGVIGIREEAVTVVVVVMVVKRRMKMIGVMVVVVVGVVGKEGAKSLAFLDSALAAGRKLTSAKAFA